MARVWEPVGVTGRVQEGKGQGAALSTLVKPLPGAGVWWV